MLEKTTYANYRKLCEALNFPIKTGNAKISQLHKLESICKYHKQGRSYIIDEIYPHPMTIIRPPEKLKHKKIHKYSEYVAPLFFSLFENSNELLVNNAYLFNQVGFCNENFGSYQFERSFIGKHPEFKKTYYSLCKQMNRYMSENVQNAINKYKKDGLITKEPGALIIMKGGMRLAPTEWENDEIRKFIMFDYETLEIKHFWEMKNSYLKSATYKALKRNFCQHNKWDSFHHTTRYTFERDRVIIEPFSDEKKLEMIQHINSGFYDRMIKYGIPKVLLDAVIKK